VDLNTNRQVAIKFLKVNPGVSKQKALECLHREIKILADCDHPNIAKIIEASFEGVIVKESSTNNSTPKPSDINQDQDKVDTLRDDKVRRKENICYYVMKLAEYGELYRFIEHTDRFSERFARTLFQ
jgi:serine/threonine protein kinase